MSVEGLDGRLGPDAESTEVTSRSQMSDVKSVDIQEVDSRNISDSSLEGLAVVITNDERTSSVLESSVSELSLTSSELLGISDSQDILIDVEGLEDLDSLLGLADSVDAVLEDQRKLRNLGDSVTSSENERGDSGGGNSGSQGVSSLLEVDLSVPSSPGSQWVSHSTSSAHVSVGTLSGSVGSGSSHSWHSGNGSTSTP